jgi:hypothetical protein
MHTVIQWISGKHPKLTMTSTEVRIKVPTMSNDEYKKVIEFFDSIVRDIEFTSLTLRGTLFNGSITMKTDCKTVQKTYHINETTSNKEQTN